ncbi:MAG: hypothetical protein AABY32_01100 [Nanoarchaeota archaeon]
MSICTNNKIEKNAVVNINVNNYRGRISKNEYLYGTGFILHTKHGQLLVTACHIAVIQAMSISIKNENGPVEIEYKSEFKVIDKTDISFAQIKINNISGLQAYPYPIYDGLPSYLYGYYGYSDKPVKIKGTVIHSDQPDPLPYLKRLHIKMKKNIFESEIKNIGTNFKVIMNDCGIEHSMPGISGGPLLYRDKVIGVVFGDCPPKIAAFSIRHLPGIK